MKTATFEAMSRGDYMVSRYLNRQCSERIRGMFVVVSRLGDGLIWYVVGVMMPMVLGIDGWRVTAMLAVGCSIGILLYKLIKDWFRRPRPYSAYRDIRAFALTLDEFSFPSGHTLHAVCFMTILLHVATPYGLAFVPFVVLTALSRVVLGLHFLSDVLFGAALGYCVAMGVLLVFGA